MTRFSPPRSSAYAERLAFTAEEQQRLTLIRQRKAALSRLRSVLTSKRVQRIAAIYNPRLSNNKTISQEEFEQIELAHTFWEVWQAEDDQKIVAISEEILNGPHKRAFTLSAQEQQRITLAQQRVAALVKFRLAIMQKQLQQIALAYDPILNDCKNVTAEERTQFQLAHALLKALQANNHRQITLAWQAIKASPYSRHFILTEQIRQRIKEAESSRARQGEPPYA